MKPGTRVDVDALSGDHLIRRDARITQLESALADAIEGLDEMLPYMDDYFVKKWELDGYAVRAKIALSFPPPDPSQAHVLRHVEDGVILWSAHWLRDGYGGHAYYYRNEDLPRALESVGAFVVRDQLAGEQAA